MAGRALQPAQLLYFSAGTNVIRFTEEEMGKLDNGIYLLQLKGESVNLTQKLIINR